MQSKLSQSYHVSNSFLKKNQDVQRSLGDYEAMETIVRAGALKESSILGSDLLPVSQLILKYWEHHTGFKSLALSDVFTIILNFDKRLIQGDDGNFAERLGKQLKKPGEVSIGEAGERGRVTPVSTIFVPSFPELVRGTKVLWWAHMFCRISTIQHLACHTLTVYRCLSRDIRAKHDQEMMVVIVQGLIFVCLYL